MAGVLVVDASELGNVERNCNLKVLEAELDISARLKRASPREYFRHIAAICAMIADLYREAFDFPTRGLADQALAQIQEFAGGRSGDDVGVDDIFQVPSLRALHDAVEECSGPIGVKLAITVFMDVLRETLDPVGSKWASLDYLLRPFVFHPDSGVDFGSKSYFRYAKLELSHGSELERNFRRILAEIG